MPENEKIKLCAIIRNFSLHLFEVTGPAPDGTFENEQI